MKNLLEYISTWSALKWIVLVLIAGFIGQFGRMTAEAIVKKIRQRRAEKPHSSSKTKNLQDSKNESVSLSAGTEIAAEQLRDAEKLEKKRIKAISKARKKEVKNKKKN